MTKMDAKQNGLREHFQGPYYWFIYFLKLSPFLNYLVCISYLICHGHAFLS